MLSLRPKCKECNDESWVKGLCYKHYQLIKNKKPEYYKRSNLQRKNMTKLPKHLNYSLNMKEPKFTFRDLLATPFFLMSFLLQYISVLIGSKWTAWMTIKLIKEDK